MKITFIKGFNPSISIRRIASLFSWAMFGLIGLIAMGCDPGLVYEKNVAVKGEAWSESTSVEFNFEIQDTLLPMNFIINLRHSTNYKYSNIFLFADTWFPNEMHTRDTLEILLAHPSGQWFGKGLGKVREIQVMIKRGVYFPVTGKYRISLQQAMREPSLEGIEDVGVRIEKTGAN